MANNRRPPRRGSGIVRYDGGGTVSMDLLAPTNSGYGTAAKVCAVAALALFAIDRIAR